MKAARSCCHPWEMAVAHRQVASIRNRICRAPRAATCRTRYREGVDLAVGQNRLVGEPDEFDQDTKSVAAKTICSHAALASNR